MNYGFHAKNGLFFDKDENGNVIIRKVSGGRIMFKLTLDSNSWASAVAHVSARGENASTFNQALQFHNQQ